MSFYQQINTWWQHLQNELNALKEALQDNATIKLANSNDSKETVLSEEASKALLNTLVQLVDAFLEEPFPELDEDDSDIDCALEIEEWHQRACQRFSTLSDELECNLSEAANHTLNNIVKLPFSLKGS